MERRVWLCVLLLITGCGSKSGLLVPDSVEPPPGRDAGMRDAGGSDAGRPDAGPPEEPCVVAPFAETTELVMGLSAQVVAADVVFLVDTTGSMGPSIDAVEDSLLGQLIPGFLREIPDVQLAVVAYQDFPISPYGGPSDLPVQVLQTSTRDEPSLQRAVERLYPRGGGDIPESGLFALHHVATGLGHGATVPDADCPEGHFGGACLRRHAVPIVCMFLDASLHDGPTVGASYLDDVRPQPPNYDETVAALDAAGITVLGLWAGSGLFGLDGRTDLEFLARDTGGVDETGRPIIEVIDEGANRVVDAVRRFVRETPISIVTASAEDVAGDEVDATRFVQNVVAARAIPADGAVLAGDHFEDVRPGTRVEFTIEVRNDFLPPMPETRRYPVRIVLFDAVNRLRDAIFYVVVPGTDGGSCD